MIVNENRAAFFLLTAPGGAPSAMNVASSAFSCRRWFSPCAPATYMSWDEDLGVKSSGWERESQVTSHVT